MLKDDYGRPVNNLRISVTQKCNLACFFCHKEGERRESCTEMTPEEIHRIVSIATSFGIAKVKLTGGEPLLRRDIVEIVTSIRDVKEIDDLAITTNGLQLEELAQPLKTAGLNRINVSLGTLKTEVYKAITGVDAISKVRRGLSEATRVGLHPIKLNMVILKGLNDGQVWEMVDFARTEGHVLQLIEVESATTDDNYYKQYHADVSAIERELSAKADRISVREMHGRRKFFLIGGGEVEVVRPMHNTEFCYNCTRLRVTSDGKLKPCLFRDDNLLDLLTSLRNNVSDDELRGLFVHAVKARRPYFA